MSAALHNETAERAVLGAVLVRNEAMDDLADQIEPDHFGRHHHRLIFSAMRTLHAAGQPVDVVTLSAQLGRDGTLADVGGAGILAGLTDGVPRSINAPHYARLVRDKALLRSLRDAGRKLIADAESEIANGAALLEDAEQMVYKLSAQSVKTDWVSGAELASELYGVVEQMTQDGKPLTGLASGFHDLDRMTRGFQSGDLVLLGARPSMGKTAWALQVALTAAVAVPVAFLSIEMARQPLGLRAVIGAAQVDGWRLLSGRLSEVEHRYVADGLSALSNARIYIDESPMLNPLQARSKLRRLQSRVGTLGLVVIDYLQLMAPLPEHRHENKTNQVAGVSRALKILAREFGCPFLVLSQLSRALERSSEKRPTLADLRDSGALEQDADVVLLLHRPEVYEQTKPELQGLAELVIGKQRNGPIGIVEMTWRAAQMRFENRART